MKLLVDNYVDELARLAANAVEIKVLIAFLTEGGLLWLPEDRAPKAEFIVGTDLGITSPTALKSLQRQGACVMIFREPGKMFHPKAIYLRTEGEEILIVGSNNLTSSGIASNHEVSLSISRNESTTSAFGDFLAHFNWLKSHACCGIPDERFFETYKQSGIRRSLEDQLRSQELPPLKPMITSWPGLDDARIGSLGDFLRLLAREYPKRNRSTGKTVKGNPLKVLNDDAFLPLFENIVSTVSHGRLTGHSQLNIGGQWYIIPNILAVNDDREPWERVNSKGRVVLQIHFDKDYSKSFFSVVLQYNLHRSVDAEQMPPQARQRFRRLLEHVENASPRAKLDMPVFRHWNYKDMTLWGKPVMTFEYSVDSLPHSEALLADLEFLANVVDAASSIS